MQSFKKCKMFWISILKVILEIMSILYLVFDSYSKISYYVSVTWIIISRLAMVSCSIFFQLFIFSSSRTNLNIFMHFYSRVWFWQSVDFKIYLGLSGIHSLLERFVLMLYPDFHLKETLTCSAFIWQQHFLAVTDDAFKSILLFAITEG